MAIWIWMDHPVEAAVEKDRVVILDEACTLAAKRRAAIREERVVIVKGL
jgi:hypothetical protein